MEIPVQISLHGIPHSDALRDSIAAEARKLDRYYSHIISCRVTLELAGRHKQNGRQFSVHIDLKVPGREIAVTHQHDEDVLVALRDAFDATRRMLEDYVRVRRGDVKRHSGA